MSTSGVSLVDVHWGIHDHRPPRNNAAAEVAARCHAEWPAPDLPSTARESYATARAWYATAREWYARTIRHLLQSSWVSSSPPRRGSSLSWDDGQCRAGWWRAALSWASRGPISIRRRKDTPFLLVQILRLQGKDRAERVHQSGRATRRGDQRRGRTLSATTASSAALTTEKKRTLHHLCVLRPLPSQESPGNRFFAAWDRWSPQAEARTR